MKRALDLIVAITLLILTSPLLIIALLAIYAHDKRWPLYSPPRVGMHGKLFHMHKLRTMTVGADQSKVDTTSANDSRITPVGKCLRMFKLDELPQLCNILRGEMSLVGPRPQIEREARLYTDAEKGLLAARPGITDFSSIVFSDLADIVAHAPDANIAYNQLVRPWKSRLGLFYIERASVPVDVALIGLTALSILSHKAALQGVAALLKNLGAPTELVEIAKREKELLPTPPPGSDAVVTSRS